MNRFQELNQSDFRTVIKLINSLDILVPIVPKIVPESNSLWYDVDKKEYIKSLPESVYCVDFETIKNTKVLVMGSAYDMQDHKWFLWLSKPESNDLVSISGKSIIIAHRSTFELGFIWESYNLDCELRFLDTHVMACQKYHPADINLYRSAPYAPMFKESNDLSLKELSEKLCGRKMDKDIVEIFINAEDERWRESYFEINKIFKAGLEKYPVTNLVEKVIKGTKGSKTKPGRPDEIILVEKKYQANFYNETWLRANCPRGTITDNCSWEFFQLLTSDKKKEAKWVWRITPKIEELFEYNCTDVSCTIGVFWAMWKWYSKLPIEYIGGLYQRSIPLLPLARDWFEQIGNIESTFSRNINEMSIAVEKTEMEYENLAEKSPKLKEKDYFDWKKGIRGKLEGKYKWRTETGLSSKKLMRISRLYWRGKPLIILERLKLDENGKIIKLKSGKIAKYKTWHTVEVDKDAIHESIWVNSCIECKNPEPLDNPTSTSKEFKDIVTVFSKKFIHYWENGDITSESKYAQEIATKYASISFWNSFRDRIINKLPVILNRNNEITKNQNLINTGNFYAATLRPLVAGTVTNRAVDPIGLVISKANYNKIGSEIGGHICAPDGWTFVFADFDAIQSRITAFYQAVAHGRITGELTENGYYDCLNNPYSKSVLSGNKKDKSNTAWLLAKQAGWWGETEENRFILLQNKLKHLQETISDYLGDSFYQKTEKEFKKLKDKADKAYSDGKNANYAMLFGAGAEKLGMMIGSYEIAVKIIAYFKGIRNKSNWKWEGGIASDYFNYSEELANGLYQNKTKFIKMKEIHSSFLKREMSNVLKPQNRGKDMAGTAQNATVQAIDVDALCYQTYRVFQKCSEEKIPVRYSTSVHDALYVLCPNEYAQRLSEIFQEIHFEMYTELFRALHLDPKTAPKEIMYYEGVDICNRWVKTTGDLGKTLSNLEGYDYSLTATLESSNLEYNEEGSLVIQAEEFITSKLLRKFALLNQEISEAEFNLI